MSNLTRPWNLSSCVVRTEVRRRGLAAPRVPSRNDGRRPTARGQPHRRYPHPHRRNRRCGFEPEGAVTARTRPVSQRARSGNKAAVSTTTAYSEQREQELDRSDKRGLALLAVPSFALALATTTVTSYMPVVAKQFTGSTLIIGVVVGAEGFLALWLPLAAGAWSDRLRTRFGGRLPFVLGATPVVVLA